MSSISLPGPNTPYGAVYELYAYDASGNMVKKARRKGGVIFSVFDNLNRVEAHTV